MTAGSSQHDRDWDAFRYVAGEMSPDEESAFEARLADDQAACEAVAQAVQMSEAVASAVTPAVQQVQQAARREHKFRVREVITIVAAAAAVCILAAVLVLRGGSGDGTVATPLASSSDSAESANDIVVGDSLADAWFHIGSPTVANDEMVSADADVLDESDFVLAELVEEDSTERLHVPDWMLAAVSHSATDDAASDATSDQVEEN